MLVQLKIKDFAIIDDLEIEFSEGMTVLTGETGSGKSIIIDAISLLLGERAQVEMVRHGKEKAVIEGAFQFSNKRLSHLLNEFGIEEDELLIIYREISKKGRNICRVNGNLVTVNQLKQLGNDLVDIHVQHDTTQLIQTNNYLYIIDSLADDNFQDLKNEYLKSYESYQDIHRRYDQLLKESRTNQAELEFYRFQLDELKQAKLSLEEYEELQQKRNMIANYDKIYENLNLANNKIKEKQILETIYEAGSNLAKIGHVNETYQTLSEQLLSAYYSLEDTVNSIGDEVSRLDYNPEELDRIESRLSVYSQLKRKYKEEVEQLIDRREKLMMKINAVDNYDDLLFDLDRSLKKQFEATYELAQQLRQNRLLLCEEIKQSLLSHLADLKLVNTSFEIEFNPLQKDEKEYLKGTLFNTDGFDTIDFLLSFNKGEPVKPLSKVASGGELSRFMLALKTVLMQKQHLSTMVFDEIDTGVSGITASAIAKKIKAISEQIQVLCITHLPQVASVADQQLLISKREVNDRTQTIVHQLSEKERIHEIAKMMTGEEVSDVAFENAKNLLKVKQ